MFFCELLVFFVYSASLLVVGGFYCFEVSRFGYCADFVFFHIVYSFGCGRVAPPSDLLVLAVVVDYETVFAVLNKSGPLIVSELCESVGKDQIFEGLARSHQAADDVAPVSGGECCNSCNLDHFVSLRSFLF